MKGDIVLTAKNMGSDVLQRLQEEYQGIANAFPEPGKQFGSQASHCR